jgi:hypothetical protein
VKTFPLVVLNVLLFAAVVWLALRLSSVESALEQSHETAPTEISVDRLNILGPNGNPVLVLAGRHRIPGPVIDGKSYSPEIIDGRTSLSGMIFFNDSGDEVGSFLFNGFETERGPAAIGHLSMDQWKQNQVVALQYNGKGESQRAGLSVWQRPHDRSMVEQLDLLEEFYRDDLSEAESAELKERWKRFREEGGHGVHRLFLGDDNGEVGMNLKDKQGRSRLRIGIADSGEPYLAFLKESGNLAGCLPRENACPNLVGE